MRILGIETSCDETAAAVVEDGKKLLSNVVASSVDLHTAFGGVVPEIAARSHLEVITPVIEEALKTAKTSWDAVDAIAVTQGPGLVGSLLIGVLTARTLAIAKNKPLYAINHVQAHPYAAFITESGDRSRIKDQRSTTIKASYIFPKQQPRFPMLALIVSGGHTQFVLFKKPLDYKLLGQTTDDAVGEAYDKVAKMLGLPYPGGPSVDKCAQKGNSTSVKLPKAKMDSPYDFSFSGLKTAVLRAAQAMSGHDYTFPSQKLPEALSKAQKADIAASFQDTAVKTLLDKLETAAQHFKPKSIVIAGGVAANQELRKQASERLSTSVIYPDIKLCTDNAAMVATLAYYQSLDSKPSDPYSLEVDPSLKM